MRNHADAIVACDFMMAVTARFQFLYVMVVLELGSRRILHCNVTAHPTAEWTLQQFREALPGENSHRFMVHDRDAIFSAEVDAELVKGIGVRVLRTPPQSPQANTFCERHGWDHAPRVPGFSDPAKREAPSSNVAGMGSPLQFWTPTQQLGTGDSRPGRSSVRPRQMHHTCNQHRGSCSTRSWRTTSRICLETSGMRMQ